MITVQELMTGPSTSPDGKHWEPSLPLPMWTLPARLRDAWEVFQGRATAVRQTPAPQEPDGQEDTRP